MGKRERVGSICNSRRQVQRKYINYVDSDEEYIAEEDEIDEQSDDELESLVADDSEEASISNFEEESEEDDEEEHVSKKSVKSRSQDRSSGPRKNKINRLKKRRKVTYDEDDDDFDEEGEEEEDEDEEENGWRKIVRPRSRKGSSGMRKNGRNRMKKRRKFAYYEEDDDSEEGSEEEEWEDEEDNGWETVVKPRSRKPSLGPRKNGINRMKKRRTVTYDDEDDDFKEEEVEDGEENGWRTVRKPRTSKGSLGPRKSGNKTVKERRNVTYDDEDDDFEEEEMEDGEENGWRTVRKPRTPKGSLGPRKSGNKTVKKRRKVTYDEEDDDFDEEDEEFTLDEIDSLDEEVETPVPKRKSKKKQRRPLKRTRRVKKRSRTKRNTKGVRKPLRKRSKKTSGSRKKPKSGNPTSRGIIRRASGRRYKRSVVSSDSDFVSLESSDYEFTISEEEREQVREANEICGSSETNLRSSRRIQEVEKKRRPVAKGKEKADDTKSDVGKQTCGICLTEEAKNIVRGTLDCCSHFFCFACIMEWSKVESRCPLCKQRFSAISKPARFVKGFDLRNAVIQIPERDQVYQPSEEELRDYLDPYENVICTECHQGGDDALMLLCDLCDSPAHTYCVGLGHEVPEGNWYCDGCRPCALGSSHSQAHDLTPNQRTGTNMSDPRSGYENMAEIDLNVTIPETPLTQGDDFISPPRHPNGSLHPSPFSSGIGVSTVSRRRRIQRQIHHLFINRSAQIPRSGQSSASDWRVDSLSSHVETSQSSSNVDRLQENSSLIVQSRDRFLGRLGNVRGDIAQASTSTDGYTRSTGLRSGLHRTNVGTNRVSGHEQLRPCTTIRSIGSDLHSSPSMDMDGHHYNAVRQ